MTTALWFGTAIPIGNWDALWQRIGTTLLTFLIRQEEYVELPGFAMQSILEITNWHELHRKATPEAMCGRELLKALQKKIQQRFFNTAGNG